MSKTKTVGFHWKTETANHEARLPPSIVSDLRKAVRRYWETNANYTELEDRCRKGGGFPSFYCLLLRFFLKKIPGGYTITDARLAIREPMPYETYVGGQLLKEGTAEGFVGIVGTAVKDTLDGQRVVKAMSRQIGKPFYQYTSRSDLILTHKPR